MTSILLILAVVGVVMGQAKISRYYQAASSSVLLASPHASLQNGSNPFLSFSPSLTLTADAVSRELMSPGTARRLAAGGFTSSYSVTLPTYTTSTTGSILLVAVTGPDPAEVENTLKAVNMEISMELAQMQHGLPARDQVHAKTLSVTPQATLSVSQTARLPVVAGTLLVVLCLGIPIFVDGLVTRRRLEGRSAPWTARRSHKTASSLTKRSPGVGQHSRNEPWMGKPVPHQPTSAEADQTALPINFEQH